MMGYLQDRSRYVPSFHVFYQCTCRWGTRLGTWYCSRIYGNLFRRASNPLARLLHCSIISYLTYILSLRILHLYLSSMQRPPDRLSVGIIPEHLLHAPNTHSRSLHWLFGKDGGYVTRLKEDYAQATPSDDFHSVKAEARIMREIADWLQSQECDEFWTPRARQPRRVGYSGKQLVICSDLRRLYPLQVNSSGS